MKIKSHIGEKLKRNNMEYLLIIIVISGCLLTLYIIAGIIYASTEKDKIYFQDTQ